ncbi:hypothetical protein [Streptomyces longispororuber]|uniref:hypothetical protein n=1 Tax=Streptomyces longispororuber TaxID=68230 RepID=UPI00210A6BD7|nr:hypothetical protein [Streptomyces longispororuber]MCQ4211416.1 hypothetical protein [Streptomyces longispororuber]
MRVLSLVRRRGPRWWALIAAALAALLAALLMVFGPSGGDTGDGAFRPRFPQQGLVTNEFAYWHPNRAHVRHSPDWTMTSGSLFGKDGAGWTGVPDGNGPDARSATGTDSAVFRLASRRRDFGQTTVRLRLRVQRMVTTGRTPSQPFDGVHIWLRFHSEQETYAVSVARRDGEVAVKRKTRGGTSNGGTYVTLAHAHAPAPPGSWRPVSTSARTLADGRVRLTLDLAGRRVLDVVDDEPGELARPGAVGIRGDNTEFLFGGFVAWGGR